jgi:hypothetical protein
LTFEGHEEVLSMVGEMASVDVVTSVNTKATLDADQS